MYPVVTACVLLLALKDERLKNDGVSCFVLPVPPWCSVSPIFFLCMSPFSFLSTASFGYLHFQEPHDKRDFAAVLDETVTRYVRAMMRNHPDTIIVVMGDHGPALGLDQNEPFLSLFMRKLTSKRGGRREMGGGSGLEYVCR